MSNLVMPEGEYQDGSDKPITLMEFSAIVREANSQPPWRAQADREADYADGNQLSSDLLRRQAMFGIPPAKENIITPAIAAVCGYEAKTRRDWRVTPDGEQGSQDVADALNYRLNQAERHSKADAALARGFKAMVTTGLGWVEVARAASALQYPYKCRYVSRNEVWWDMQAREADLSDARWLFRRRWVTRQRAAQLFPEHRELILHGLEKWMADSGDMLDGGVSTGLLAAADAERAWTQVEDAWYNSEASTVAVTELWYRRWVPVLMLKAKERVVRYDDANELHRALLMAGHARLIEEVAPQMRRAYWMGPHLLHDDVTPYPHHDFPYVMVVGYQEDMTGVPYGIVRDMMFPQDNINSSIAKLRWGMSVVRTERTKGAVAMSDDQYRRQISRANADIILDPAHMAMPGARYEVKRDFELNNQQFQLMQDSRAAMERVSGISVAFMGQQGTATSGVQEQTQLEQSQVTLGLLMDRFQEARTQVGELLLSLIIEDLGREPQAVVIEGDTINPPRTVQLNLAEIDPATGVTYLSNDVQRARLMVALEDVPTTSSFRAQQLNTLGEAIKSMPPEMQQVAMPFLVDLMDLPRKEQVVQAIRDATAQPDPEQAKEQAKQELMYDLKERELAIREREIAAKEKLMQAQTVNTGVTSTFAAMQAAEKIAMNPLIAPVGDVVLQGSGYRRPTPEGQDPNLPGPGQMPSPADGVPAQDAMGGEPGDSSPLTPSNPVKANVGAGQGIETLRAD